MAKVAKDAKNAKLKRDLKEDSTILHEHRRIIAVRYLLALVNFAAILLGTLITRYFVLIRGASEGLILHINLLCIINAVQIGLCLLDYFLRNRGIYNI
jgi:hypothetical protein